jgi:hypothetical protein
MTPTCVASSSISSPVISTHTATWLNCEHVQQRMTAVWACRPRKKTRSPGRSSQPRSLASAVRGGA